MPKESLRIPSLEVFLLGIGLEKYIQLFKFHDVEISELLFMSENDYVRIGISSLRHRKHPMNSVVQLIKTIQGQYLEIQKDKGKIFTKKFLRGYAIFISIVAIVLQITVREKMLTGISFIDGLIFGTGLAVFMVPSLMAWLRFHPYKWAILIGNIFLGGTRFGWVISLVFALGAINAATEEHLFNLSKKDQK